MTKSDLNTFDRFDDLLDTAPDGSIYYSERPRSKSHGVWYPCGKMYAYFVALDVVGQGIIDDLDGRPALITPRGEVFYA